MLILAECTDESLEPIIGIIKAALVIVQILIPIGLIIYGTIDLGRAVISSDEKKIQEGQKTLMKRALAAALVFFIATIVTFLMGFVGNDTWKDCWTEAEKCEEPNPITGDCCSNYDHDNNPETDGKNYKYDENTGKCVPKP